MTSLLEKLNERLRIQLQQLSQESQIVVGVDRRKITPRPNACPSCGCDVIWKNGTYNRRDGQVQRFRCSACGTKIFMEVKKTP